MWYLIKCVLKVQVDKVHCFVVTSVIGVNDTGKEVKQAFQATALVSETMLRVTYQVVARPLLHDRGTGMYPMDEGHCHVPNG